MSISISNSPTKSIPVSTSSLAGLARLGDPSNHGGAIVSVSGKALVNGMPVAVAGDLHSCPVPGHGITPLTSTSRHFSGGKGLIRVGDVAGCGAVITNGSSNVLSA